MNLVRRVGFLTLTLLFSCLFGYGLAQTAHFGVSLDNALRIKPVVTVSDIQEGRVRYTVRLAGGVSGPLELGLGVRSVTSLLTLGNVDISGNANADVAGRFELSASGSAVIANIGARARLSAFNSNPGQFDPEAAFATGARPRYDIGRLSDNVALGIGGGVTYRLERDLILVLDPDLVYLTGSGFGAHLSGALQLRRLIDRDEGRVRVLADLEPGATRGYGAAGFEYLVERRDWPLLTATVWLGAGSEGVWPGAQLSVADTLALEGVPLRYDLTVAAEPFRSDALPYRASVSVEGDIEPGTLRVTALAAPVADETTPGFTVKTTYQLGF